MRRKFKEGALPYGCGHLEVVPEYEAETVSYFDGVPVPCKHAYDIKREKKRRWRTGKETFVETTWKVPFSVNLEDLNEGGYIRFCGLCLKEAVDETVKALGLEDGAPSSRTQPRKI